MGNAPPVIVPQPIRTEVERRLRDDDLDLPVLPKVAMDVLQLCRSAEADAQKISDILHGDQSIAGNVMRIANSPLSGASVKITSLQQAVSRLGIRHIVELVVAISTQGKMFEVPAKWQPVVGDVRHASLVTALCAKEVARMGRANVETAFLQGLLHDMGKPILLMLLDELEERTGAEWDLDEISASIEELHASIGARLCESWDLPEPIGAAISHQNDWQGLDDPPQGAPLISLASQIAEIALGDEEHAVSPDALDGDALEQLNLYPDEAAELCGMTDHLVEVAAELGS